MNLPATVGTPHSFLQQQPHTLEPKLSGAPPLYYQAPPSDPSTMGDPFTMGALQDMVSYMYASTFPLTARSTEHCNNSTISHILIPFFLYLSTFYQINTSEDSSLPKSPSPHLLDFDLPTIFPDTTVGPGLPLGIHNLDTLPHNEIVCAVAISNPVRHIYTGGMVKISQF